MKKIILALSTSLLFACSTTSHVASAPVAGGGQCYQEGAKDRSVRLDLIRQLVDEGQYYSALAHLEREKFDSDGARFLVAESLRKTGRLDLALENYENVQKGCLRAFGHLGTGKILAVQGRLDKALPELKIARDLLPTDANIRNDYGFALLASGNFKAARQEFVTAIQLEKHHDIAVRNLILSLILDGDTKMAWTVADHHQIGAQDFQSLMARSAQFQKQLDKQRVVHLLSNPESGIDRPILVRKGASL